MRRQHRQRLIRRGRKTNRRLVIHSESCLLIRINVRTRKNDWRPKARHSSQASHRSTESFASVNLLRLLKPFEVRDLCTQCSRDGSGVDLSRMARGRVHEIVGHASTCFEIIGGAAIIFDECARAFSWAGAYKSSIRAENPGVLSCFVIGLERDWSV